METRRHRGFVPGLIQGIAERFLPEYYADVIAEWRAEGGSKDGLIAEIAVTLSLFAQEQIRQVFWGDARIRRGPMPLQERQKRSDRVNLMLKRMLIFWGIGCAAYMAGDVRIFDATPWVQRVLPALGFLTLGCAFALQCGDLEARARKDVRLSLFRNPRVLDLNVRLHRLFSGAWSPSRFPVRAALEAVFFVDLNVPFIVAFKAWYSGEPLSLDHAGWPWFVSRVCAFLMLLLTWVCLRKCNMLATLVLQEELEALEALKASG